MGAYLTDAQLQRLRKLLTVAHSMPFGTGMTGDAFEGIFAEVKGGVVNQEKKNRPVHDAKAAGVRYSLKTGNATMKGRSAAALRGLEQTLIMARLPIDDHLEPGELHRKSADEIGEIVIQAFNDIATRHWDRLGVLVRVRRREFLYWEAAPPRYDASDYAWQDSGRAKGGSRNVLTCSDGASELRWNSRGGQFYAVHRIPVDADLIRIRPRKPCPERLYDFLLENADLVEFADLPLFQK